MDELTFRRRIYANPHDQDNDIMDAIQNDSGKAKFKADMSAFDLQIKSALEIDVPDNFAEKILLNQSMHAGKSAKRKQHTKLAIAASMLLTVSVSLSLMTSPNKQSHLIEHAIAHLQSEIEHIPTNQQYSIGQLNSKLASFGGELLENIGNIKFVSFCTFQGTRSLHIVLSDGNEDVTVFVLPKKHGLTAQQTFETNTYNGQQLTSERADLVVISNKSNSTKDWSTRLNKSIKWQKA